MPQFTTKQILLIGGIITFLLGTGYNIYDWNATGQSDSTVQLFGLFLIVISFLFKKKDLEG
jgi:drug/metabolite transporter (DMT)-like permease